MAKSIAEYTAEISKSYDNSRNALQNQINAIEGGLAQTKKQINENYDNQQTNIDNQKNWAASSASMAASRNGGSFGGATELANKKYYEQTFVPAQTQLNTNRSQALENAQSQANSNRLTLEQQLASMNDEISRLGVQRYYDVLEQEREDAYRQQQLALQKQQIAAQNAAASYLGRSSGTGSWGQINSNDPAGFYFYDNAGNPISMQRYLDLYGAQTGETREGVLSRMAQAGDFNASRALAGLRNANNELTDEERSAFGTLGIDTSGYGRRA